MLTRISFIIVFALALSQAAYALYIHSPFDDLIVPFTLETDNAVPPLFIDPLDDDLIGVELTVKTRVVFTRCGSELKFYMAPLPEDLGDRTHVDLEWWNVNDVNTGIKWVEFTCYWKGGDDDAHPWAHDFAGPQSYQQGAKFVTPEDSWMSITDIFGQNICRVSNFMKQVNIDRPFGRAGDQVKICIMDPQLSKPTLTKNLTYNATNPLQYRLRNWRYYNPAYAGQRWDTHFDNPRNWDRVYVYAWAETSSGVKRYTGDWPGTLLSPDPVTGKYEASFKVVDAYGLTGVTFNNGQGDNLKFAHDTHTDATNDGAYSQILIAIRLEKPTYDAWQQVYAYSQDGRFGDYPGTLMTPWPTDGSLPFPYPHHAPQLGAPATSEFEMYYAVVPGYVDEGLDVAFVGKSQDGTIVGQFPEEDSGQWVNMHDWNCFTLTSNPASDTVTSTSDIELDAHVGVVEYYDLLGRKIAIPTPGQVVLRRQGTTVTKVLER